MIASGALAICYGTGDEEFAVAAFRSCSALKLGGPNDETLNGHPLYRYGLKNYSIHRIRSSPWIAELEQQNSVHPLHDATRFLEGKVHYLFALKEETVECIVEKGLAKCQQSPSLRVEAKLLRTVETQLRLNWSAKADACGAACLRR